MSTHSEHSDAITASPQTIVIHVRGGVVQSVEHIPKGIVVRIQDYDVECYSPAELSELTEGDQEGNRFTVDEWQS